MCAAVRRNSCAHRQGEAGHETTQAAYRTVASGNLELVEAGLHALCVHVAAWLSRQGEKNKKSYVDKARCWQSAMRAKSPIHLALLVSAVVLRRLHSVEGCASCGHDQGLGNERAAAAGNRSSPIASLALAWRPAALTESPGPFAYDAGHCQGLPALKPRSCERDDGAMRSTPVDP